MVIRYRGTGDFLVGAEVGVVQRTDADAGLSGLPVDPVFIVAPPHINRELPPEVRDRLQLGILPVVLRQFHHAVVRIVVHAEELVPPRIDKQSQARVFPKNIPKRFRR